MALQSKIKYCFFWLVVYCATKRVYHGVYDSTVRMFLSRAY